MASLVAACGLEASMARGILIPLPRGLNARVPPWKVDSQPLDHQGGLCFVFIVERCFPRYWILLDRFLRPFQHVEYAISLPFGFHFSDNKSAVKFC